MLFYKSRSISRNSCFIGQYKTKCKGVRLSHNSLTFVFGKGSIFAGTALLAATGWAESIRPFLNSHRIVSVPGTVLRN